MKLRFKKVITCAGFLLFVIACVIFGVPWIASIAKDADHICTKGDCVHGTGTMEFSTGEIYTGQFKDGLPHGLGLMIYNRESNYRGEWRLGRRHGEGVYVTTAGIYRGQFVDDRMEGLGTFHGVDGSSVRGSWVDGFASGLAVVSLPSGLEMIGQYEKGLIENGEGQLIYEDGTRYVGSWHDGQRHGSGVIINGDGQVEYAGEWKNDLPLPLAD